MAKTTKLTQHNQEFARLLRSLKKEPDHQGWCKVPTTFRARNLYWDATLKGGKQPLHIGTTGRDYLLSAPLYQIYKQHYKVYCAWKRILK